MKPLRQKIIFFIIVGLPIIGFACDVCRGNPEAPLSKGMDMGIITLLGVTGSVLGGFASFFMYLKKQALRHQNKTNNNIY